MATEKLLSSATVCAALGIDRTTLTRWVASGRITAEQKLPGVTGANLFTQAEVDRVAAESKIPASP